MDIELYNREIDFIFNRFPSFQKVGGSAYKPGLDTMEKLSSLLGMPHRKFLSVHVAGTNGKGSTSHMIASALSMLVKSSGERLKVGLYTSPHLIDFRERMKVSEGEQSALSGAVSFRMPSRDFVYSFLVRYKDDFLKTGASFFEITTAMAFSWFATEDVDIAVIECGLGGRLDATNILTPELGVITNIGLDHCEYLGNTLADVAKEKAGIIKPFTPVVIGERSGVADVFALKAKECSAPIVFAEDFKPVSVKWPNSAVPDLKGDCQVKNIRTVVAAIETLLYGKRKINCSGDIFEKLNLKRENVQEKLLFGICNAAGITGLHGRWEILGKVPFIVCDTGHNAHGFAVLGEQIKRKASGVSEYTGREFERLIMFFGAVADKDLNSISSYLPETDTSYTSSYTQDAYRGIQTVYYFVNAKGTRALPAVKLQEKMKSLGFKGEVLVDSGDIKESLEYYMKNIKNDTDFVFIGGSTFVVAEALEYFKHI